MNKKGNTLVIIIIFLAIFAVGLYLVKGRIVRQVFKPTASTTPNGDSESAEFQTVAQDLTVPWEIAFLPTGDILVTERSGTLKRIGQNNQTYVIEGVSHSGEGGLLGLALHPDFKNTQLLYIYFTSKTGEKVTNRVERYKFSDDKLSQKTSIVADIPGAANHDGGRLAFGQDGKLYVTTGDAAVQALSQDKNSLAGKILRLNPDGSVPSDNPFGNAVYSYGHRNPQGLAWDSRGQLWATEHGSSGEDELNKIQKGANYGWPDISGDESGPGISGPVVHSGKDETWAPAGLSYYGDTDSLFFSGLRGEALYQAKIKKDGKVELVKHFRGQFGRLRANVIGNDAILYISTSNTDGRGDTKPNDDKIISLNPRSLGQ